MPRSSGGGSHSGGSHSHSHSHSGGSHRSGRSGSSSSKPVIMSSPHIGYSRYAYYRDGRINYQYVKDKPDGYRIFTMIFIIVFMLQFLAVGIFMLLSSITYVTKIDDTSYDSIIRIEDNIDVMTDAQEIELSDTLEAFKQKTGIACSVITVHNSEWKDYYTGLENYAYDLYVNHWSDEKHWLFVYSQPEDVDTIQFNDWYWEGMMGYDTEDILTDTVTESFNDDVHKYLLQTDVSVAGAFDTAMKDLTESIKVNHIAVDPGMLMPACIWLLMCVVFLFGSIGPLLKSGKQEKQQIKTLHETGIPVSETPLEDTCDYCGGLFIHGVHTSCPHCAAPIQPLS